jgi:hypothetical protein
MVQRERDEEAPGLTEMVMDTEPDRDAPIAKREEHRDPPEGEDELPLAGQ